MSSMPPCDREIFTTGKPILAVDTGDCGAERFELWVRAVATRSGQPVDWHYSGGIANVLYIGDRVQVTEAVQMILCPGRIMRWFEDADPGLHRAGVTPAPAGAIAAWYEGGSGNTFAVGETDEEGAR